MKHVQRPSFNHLIHLKKPGWRPLPALALPLVLPLALAVASALAAGAQAASLRASLDQPMLLGSSSQGYLGVELDDVDAAKAQSLKLKDVRGAVITLIDHDAPAGKIGLHVNDVVLEINGQSVEGAEQARRILHETPAGRKLSLTISRDGATQSLTVELADRKAVEHDAWNHIDTGGDLTYPGPGMGILPGGTAAGDVPSPSSWHLPFFGGSVNVGVLVEPLTRQMADVLGLHSGLMIKQVTHRTAASAAGLKALDIIVKVGNDPVTSLSAWERAMRSNQGKSVQVTILRDRKMQTLTLEVDSKRHS